MADQSAKEQVLREEFEKWAIQKMSGILYPGSWIVYGGDERTGYYCHSATAWTWAAWQAARASSPDAADLLARIERAEQGRDNLLRHLQDEDLKLRPILERHGFDPEHHTVFMLLEHLERKASPVAIPEGYQLVPKEPTEEMIQAAAAHVSRLADIDPDDTYERRAERHRSRGCAIAMYSDAIAAAPPSPGAAQ